ncbi:MAG TPA: hypothetical protein VJ775_01425 [Sphingomicrobium sp.]|nr:hypothetical protein [Sphingomicrobium sp.]
MADGEDDVLELTDEVDPGEPDDGQEEGADETKTDPNGEGEEEFDVVFGDEAAPASGEQDSGLVKHLRETNRAQARELAELRKAASSQPIVVGPKPTLASCEYDEERYEAERDAWDERKRQAEQAESEAERSRREGQEQWQREVQSYEAKKARLTFGDVDEAISITTSALDQVQQAVIVKVADNPALLKYSLGKHPAKLAELSQIKDPLKMAAAVAKLEGGLKVTPKRKGPAPEEIVTGSGSVAAGRTDKELERLEKEAERTGDRTKVIAYRRSLKKAA